MPAGGCVCEVGMGWLASRLACTRDTHALRACMHACKRRCVRCLPPPASTSTHS